MTQLLTNVPTEQTKLVFFNSQLVQKLATEQTWSKIVVNDENQAVTEEIDNHNLVLVDMPDDEKLLAKLLYGKKPKRLYVHFYQNQQHFFSTLPTREHFKWLYAFLMKKGPLDIKRYSDDIAKHKGWSKDTVDFICQVFFELGFVTIDNGIMGINKSAAKRDVSEAPSYKRKQQQIKMENELLYSSYQQLYEKIQCYFTGKELEEEMN